MKTDFKCEKFGFEVCRICMTPKTNALIFTSVFDDSGAKAEMLKILTGFDNIIKDENKYDALICDKCCRKLENFYEFRRRSRHAERNYFRLLRDNEESEDLNGMLKSVLSFEEEQFELISEFDQSDENAKLIKVDSFGSSMCDKSNSCTGFWQHHSTTPQVEHKPSSTEVILILKETKIEVNQQTRIDSNNSQQKTEVSEGLHLSKQCSSLNVFPKASMKLADLKISKGNTDDDVKLKNRAIFNMFSTQKTLSEKTFKCKICSKVLATKQYLRQHFVSMHNGQKNFTCDFCSKSVYHKHHMIYHMKLHIKNPDYKGATSDKERPFKCHLCPRYFETLHVLRQHLISHSYFRQFRCWCGSSFKTKGVLKAHRQNIHREEL